MIILIVGATGATGRLLVKQLLKLKHSVKIIVRGTIDLPEEIRNHKNLTTVHATILALSETEMAQHVKGCNAIVSCLGHNISVRGIFGQPRRLVTDATRRLCNAVKINDSDTIVKFVLMNTTANSNRDLLEKASFSQKIVTWLIRLLLPPHVDNEKAADVLRTEIGQNNDKIEWVAVRPDGLIDESKVTEYEVYPSPIRNPIFDAGTVSRINVAFFIAELITDQHLWVKWKGQMPVIYSKSKK